MYPKIQSPCPYADDLAAIMSGDVCTMCKRKVLDLSVLSAEARVAYLRACREEVCVSYKLPLGRALAAALTAAVLTAPLSAAAQDTDEMLIFVVGGIKDPSQVEFVDIVEEALPDLPVIEEAAQADASPAAAADLGGALQTQ